MNHPDKGSLRAQAAIGLIFGLLLLSLVPACTRTFGPPVSPVPLGATPTPTDTAVSPLPPSPTSSPFNTYTAVATHTFTSTPTATATSSPTATLTVTPTSTGGTLVSPTPTTTGIILPTGIDWTEAILRASGSNTNDQLSLIQLTMVVNGAPETTCGVTLITPQQSIPVPCVSGSGYANYYLNLTPLGLAYVPGAVYTLVSNTSLGMASASVTAPGGNVAVSSNAATCTWTYPGNLSSATIDNINTNIGYYSPYGITSPYVFPSSAFSGSGAYYINLLIENQGPAVNTDGEAQFLIIDPHTFSMTL